MVTEIVISSLKEENPQVSTLRFLSGWQLRRACGCWRDWDWDPGDGGDNGDDKCDAERDLGDGCGRTEAETHVRTGGVGDHGNSDDGDGVADDGADGGGNGFDDDHGGEDDSAGGTYTETLVRVGMVKV